MRHPIGFNVRPGVDYSKLRAQVQRMGGCRALLVHCYIGQAHDLYTMFASHVDMFIWRPADWIQERLYIDAPDAAAWCAQIYPVVQGKAKMWVHLHNETGWSNAVIDWECRAIDWGMQTSDMRFVALNQAVGNPNEREMTRGQPILRRAAANPDRVVIGIHDGYFSVFGDRSAPWYLGRWQATFDNGHGFESLRKSLGLGPVRYVVTEAGAEDIADDHAFTSQLPRTGGRQHIGPVHANDTAWRTHYGAGYPGLDMQYIREIERSWTLGHLGDARIAGYCLFSWGVGGRWADYDVSTMGAFLDQLTKWKPPVTVTEDESMTTLVKPDDSIGNAQRVRLQIARNMRYGPGTQYGVVQLVEANSEVEIYPAVAVTSGQYIWHWTGTGWVADNVSGTIMDVVTPPTPEPEPQPEVPPILLPDDWQDTVRSMMHEVIRETLAHEMSDALTTIGETAKALTAVQYRRANAIAHMAEVEAANYGLMREALERIYGIIEPETEPVELPDIGAAP